MKRKTMEIYDDSTRYYRWEFINRSKNGAVTIDLRLDENGEPVPFSAQWCAHKIDIDEDEKDWGPSRQECTLLEGGHCYPHSNSCNPPSAGQDLDEWAMREIASVRRVYDV